MDYLVVDAGAIIKGVRLSGRARSYVTVQVSSAQLSVGMRFLRKHLCVE